MKAKILGAVVAMMLAGPAIAADIPVKAPVGKAPFLSNFDVAFGGAIMTDYNFRGISQSDRRAAGGAYVEGQWKTNPSTVYYLGLAATSVSWPQNKNLSDPAAEIDFYGGARYTAGKWAFDVGGIFYLYPGEFLINSEFFEVYAKAAYTVNDNLTVGGAIFYSPDYLNYGIDSIYSELNAKYTVKNTYVSGAFGHMHLSGTTSGAINVPSYNYWNVGVGATWKQFTLDLRYHDTDLSDATCNAVWNVATGPQKSCGQSYIAKLSFDTTVSAHK